MLILRTFFLLITLVLSNSLMSREEPLSIVIIGGGPGGLSTAIEAKAAGANVMIVEKRESFLRDRYVFLLAPTLNLLDKWEVTIQDLIVFNFDETFGLTNIKKLEAGLAQRVDELKIPRINGEFLEFKDDGKIVILQQDQQLELSYDILVGADGTHSRVRNLLGIATNLYDHAVASIAIIPIAREVNGLEFILPFKSHSIFINKITLPSATLFFTQGKEMSKEILLSEIVQLGWEEEAEILISGNAKYTENIEVFLQQSTEFSDRMKSTILIGDAAATASYLRGKGANCALESATIAGRFFKTEQNDDDYAAFNHAMKEMTDGMILDSLFLFE